MDGRGVWRWEEEEAAGWGVGEGRQGGISPVEALNEKFLRRGAASV